MRSGCDVVQGVADVVQPSETRIVFFTPTSDGGHARYSKELLTALTTTGAPFRFELATSQDLADEFCTDRYPIHRLLPALRHRTQFTSRAHWAASRARHYLARERSFLRWLESQRGVRLVHLQEYSSWLGPWFIAGILRLGIRVACSVHNVTPHLQPVFPLDRLERGLTRRALRQCDLLVTHTAGLRRALTSALGEESRAHIHVVPHGVWSVPSVERRRSGPGARLLCFGTLRRNKGFDVAIDALSHLPDARLTLAGPPEDAAYASDLERRIATSRHRGRVDTRFQFIPTAEVSGLFESADLVLLPYRDFAAQSGVLHLAIAYGVPVVVTDVGGLGELVREYKVGRVLPELSASALAREVREALSPSRRAELERNLAAARGEMSWDRAAHVLSGLYARMLFASEGARDGDEPLPQVTA